MMPEQKTLDAEVTVRLTDEEFEQRSEELARKVLLIHTLEAKKKRDAKKRKDEIDRVQGEAEALARIIEAARVMDALFLRQVWAGNDTLLFDLTLQRRSRLGEARLHAFLVNTGPWSRLDEDAPFVPGVPAMSSCSAALATPICLGDEKVAIIPATFSDHKIVEILNTFDTVVLMKVHRVLPKIVSLLGDCGLLDQAYLVERAGMVDEKVLDVIDLVAYQPHYYSTIIVRRNAVHARVLVN